MTIEHLTAGSLIELARAARTVPVTSDDRIEFGRALILQGYAPAPAARMSAVEILDNDGALQMLARHRIRFSSQVRQ
ncbi:hypothetical protein [Novosphingobium sp. Leaf2]|uniref:hypothetical protein n=1 Tax=Novosphingobium sp. Leaf2 TaxID=1735670 RepID=UPI0006F89B1C|nr:hypothetical protein [Novosphingobium sp. Leaf2]KQM21919.1 hypothetical protein ASE49_00985 [Novosphingobium sp. Leaf2]